MTRKVKLFKWVNLKDIEHHKKWWNDLMLEGLKRYLKKDMYKFTVITSDNGYNPQIHEVESEMPASDLLRVESENNWLGMRSGGAEIHWYKEHYEKEGRTFNVLSTKEFENTPEAWAAWDRKVNHQAVHGNY